MALHNLNLNLLPTLRELLRHRSITDAAKTLGRSPSAISQGLAQLRLILDDPLLVRAGGGMVLTPRAEQLIGPVEDAYAGMERALHLDRFDPAQAARQFVVAATDFDAFAYGPTIMAAIRAGAPNVQIRFVDIGNNLDDQVIARTVDVALLPDFLLAELASDRMRFHPVGTSATVAMMRAGHPLASTQSIDREMLDRWGHVGLFPSWEAMGRRPALLAKRQPAKSVVIVPQSMLLAAFVVGSDHIALAPDIIAEQLGEAMGLTHRPLAFEEPLVRSVVAWGPSQQADPAHRWLRDTLIQAAQSIARRGKDQIKPKVKRFKNDDRD